MLLLISQFWQAIKNLFVKSPVQAPSNLSPVVSEPTVEVLPDVLLLTDPLPEPIEDVTMPLVSNTVNSNRVGVANTVAFSGQVGINIMWPFMGPTVINEKIPNSPYSPNPFANPAPWGMHITPTLLESLRSRGFDSVRLPITPGPFIEALKDQSRMGFLFSLFEKAVKDCIQAGLAVNIDLHDSYYLRNTPNDLLKDGVGGDLFQKRIEVTQYFAHVFSKYNPAMLCLELFNEPLEAGSIKGDWVDYQKALYSAVREIMPNHTLLLTMENYSMIDQLARANPMDYDDNTLWVIHPYIPSIYTLQGYTDSSFSKYVKGIKWPPNKDQHSGVVAAMTAAVNADTSLSSLEKKNQIASTTETLKWYFTLPEDVTRLKSYMAPVKDWCKKHGISPNRVIANEYGATRSNASFQAGDENSRILWINAMTKLLSEAGHRKMVFSLDAIDYGITNGVGSTIGAIDSRLIF